jgi:prephenate dehydrogenase
VKNIKKITVIGLGLIGGSLAISLKELNENFLITGFDSEADAMSIARYRKIIDRIGIDYKDSVKDADLVVIATPISHIYSVIKEIKDWLKKGAIVTDVGSAKAKIVKEVADLLPDDVIFIGGHPMAGSENEGVLSANPGLFRNAFYILTPTGSTKTEALMALHTLYTKMGSIVVTIEPEEHDKIVSLISHLPHVLSTNLVKLVNDKQKEIKNLFKLSAGGFRDMTRIATSNPRMWVDITIENKKEIALAINEYIKYLEDFRDNLESSNEDFVKDHYMESRKARINLPKFIEKDISKLYELMISIPDKKGVLSEVTLAISSKGINIEDISIFHSTEVKTGGILKILVQGENAGEIAKEAIESKGYDVRVRKVIGS